MNQAAIFFGIIVLIAAIITVKKGVILINQAEVMLIERFGRYKTTLQSGLNFIMPYVDKPREIMWKETYQRLDGRTELRTKYLKKIDLREVVYDFPKQNVITSDNVTIQINALLYFQIMDPKKAVYEIKNLPEAIEKLTQTTLRNVIGELDLDGTLTSRDTINDKLRAILDDATDKWGVKVNRVELQDIIPPKEIRESMEKQMKAERTKRASILEAEGSKISKVLRAEGERDAEIARAEGEKRAKILEAEGQAEARVKVAEAEAIAIDKVKSSLSEEKDDPASYLIAVKYIEAFQKISEDSNDKTVFMPYEASAMLGSIGGIKELLSPKK